MIVSNYFGKKVYLPKMSLILCFHASEKYLVGWIVEVLNLNIQLPPVIIIEEYYFKALDLAITSIRNRFEQPGYQVYRHLQDLLLNVAQHKEYQSDLQFITKFYDSDLSPSLLEAQLQAFATKFKDRETTLTDVIEQLKKLITTEKELLSEVCTLSKLMLVRNASNKCDK